MRLRILTFIFIGALASACAPVSRSVERRVEQRPASAPPAPVGPHLATTELLLAIESDVNGKSVEPARFGLELLLDEKKDFLFLNLYRQDSKLPAVPDGEGFSSAAARERICEENSKKGKENCLADIDLLAGSGVVIERFFNRPGVILQAEKDFSRTEGGNLVLRYIGQADIDDSAKDIMAEYRLRLERSASGWVLLSVALAGTHDNVAPSEAPATVGSLKLSSKFAGMYANGVESIEVASSKHRVW